MSIDTAAIVKLSLVHEYVTRFYVRSESNFKLIGVIYSYDTNILTGYEVCVRGSNYRSFWFNYLENREKLADRKKILFCVSCFLFCKICPPDTYLGVMTKCERPEIEVAHTPSMTV
jgi:hypothetical protein